MPFPAQVSATTIDGATGVQIYGTSTDRGLGWSAAFAGDINGDGIDDLIISGQYASPNGVQYAGVAYVVFGKAGGIPNNFSVADLNGANGFRIPGKLNGDFLGSNVAAAGDVNNDGVDDLIVAAKFADTTSGLNTGAVYVIFGHTGPFSANLDPTTLTGSNGFAMTGKPNDTVGQSVSSAGDVNGDGFDDVLVGGVFVHSNGNYHSGVNYLVFGAAGGFPANIDLSMLDGTNGFAINGVGESDRLGEDISSAGDVNGDGFDDLLVASFYARGAGGQREGAAYVIFGKADGFTATMNVAELDGTDGFKIIPTETGKRFAESISDAGDVNGDGFADVLIGMRTSDANGSSSGSAYVVFGKAGGFSAIFDLANLDGTNGFRMTGGAVDQYGFSVASAGDFNNDGYDDVMVGAPYSNGTGDMWNARYKGGVAIVYGKVGGFAASIDLTTLDGTDGFTFVGEPSESVGWAIDGGGDFNGDGALDLLFSSRAMLGPNGESGFGGAYILYGEVPPVTFVGGAGDDTRTGGAAADNLSGANGKDTLSGAGGNDIIDGGDGNDLLDGGAGLDQLQGGLGNDVVNGGAGDDVLRDSGGSNKLSGGDGNDQLFGASGADRLAGEADDDTLEGGAGNDYLDGGTGVNSLTGGAGNDVFIVNSDDDTVIELGGEGTDTVRAFVTYELTANVEVLELQGAADIDGAGNGLANTVKGNGGANVLSGGAGADKLDGGAGNDILIGGTGRDQLTGGAGDDTFRVLAESLDAAPLEIDTVLDYVVGEDILDFSQIDADSDADNGDTAFTVSTTGLHRVAGELYAFYTAVGDVTTVRLDIDGDGVADYQMAIKGNVVADTGNWLL